MISSTCSSAVNPVALGDSTGIAPHNKLLPNPPFLIQIPLVSIIKGEFNPVLLAEFSIEYTLHSL